jgi:hypothetical protein
VLGQNLVFNGDAEYNRGFNSNSTQQYAAGWDNPGPGGITTINYLASGGFPSPTDPGPADRGDNFFSGGTNLTSTMTQRIDVTNLAATIGGGHVSFLLSAWLGGYFNQNDTATVIAHFLNSSNAEIGAAQLAPVTAAERGNVTKFLLREQLAGLPSQTRFINLELSAVRLPTGENDGYADNIALTLLLTGDLDFNGLVNVSDWSIFRSGQQVNMTGLTLGQAFALGDLNGDLRNDHADFVMFKSTFDAANGVGAFVRMLASVPESSTIALCALALSALIGERTRRRRQGQAALVFEADPAQPAAQRFSDQVANRFRGRVDRQALRADVRNAIAVRVGVTGLGRVDQISAEAIRRPQSGPFSDERQCELGAEQLSDLILQRHAAEAGDHDRRKHHAVAAKQWQKLRE